MDRIIIQWNVEEIYRRVGDDVLARWENLGKMDSDIHWAYGREVDNCVKMGMPLMLVYKAIGRKAGKASSTIAQSYYTFRAFKDVIEEYDPNIPYSVYNHARQWHEPDEVLQYYMDNRCSVDEVEAVFRVSEEPEERETFAKTELPRYFVGAWREMVGLPKERYKLALQKLHEFMEIVNG